MALKTSFWIVILCTTLGIEVRAQELADSAEFEEIIVYSTKVINPSGARYHIDGCRYLKNGQFKVDERQALERGLLPCSVCLPDRPEDLPFLRTKKENRPKKVYRKCVYKTKSGSKCERAALEDDRYCELHQSRGTNGRR